MEELEKAKDIIQELDIPIELKIIIQGLLSSVRSIILREQARAGEAMARQDVYANVCEKMLNRMISNKYD